MLIATILMALVISFFKDFNTFLYSLLYSFLIIFISIFIKKLVASYIQVKIEHKLLWWKRFFIYERSYFKNPIPIGLLLPIFVSLISGGIIKIFTFLKYEVTPKKSRVTKKRTYPRFTELTEWDIGLMGIWGIGTTLFLSLFGLIIGQVEFAQISALYSLWNLIPLFEMDGTKILFGSKLAWVIEAILSVIMIILVYLIPAF